MGQGSSSLRDTSMERGYMLSPIPLSLKDKRDSSSILHPTHTKGIGCTQSLLPLNTQHELFKAESTHPVSTGETSSTHHVPPQRRGWKQPGAPHREPEEGSKEQPCPGPFLIYPEPLQQHRGPSREHSWSLHRAFQQEKAADASISVEIRITLL